MAMQMWDGFARIFAIVNDQAESSFLEAHLSGDLCCLQEEMTKNGVIIGLRFGNPRDGLLWDDEQMGGRCWFDVAKGKHKVIFVYDVGGQFARDDFFEESFAHEDWCLADYQASFIAAGFCRETFTKVLDNLVAENLTTRCPAFGTCEFLDTCPEALEGDGI